MAIKHLLKFYRYAFAWENYLLLARTWQAARLVRRLLPQSILSPSLAEALPAVNALYLPPQAGWHISDAEKIARFASFAVSFPFRWGRCLQQALILYRLLNGYGIPARICFGINPAAPQLEGHAWVVRLSDASQAFAEPADPQQRFKLIYTSPLPASARPDGL